MPITPYHIILNALIYAILVKFGLINSGDYLPLLIMITSNLIDIDHLLRSKQYRKGGRIVYGLNLYILHGWWSIILSIIMIFFSFTRWFGVGWLSHLILDCFMVYGKRDFLLRKRKDIIELEGP